LIVAMELQEELVRDNLTRRQLAERHGITSDRVTQWLCLLKLPDHEKARVLALGDNWERQVVTERQLRYLKRNS
jgi:transcriptional regulator with XRE-family HTH domain